LLNGQGAPVSPDPWANGTRGIAELSEIREAPVQRGQTPLQEVLAWIDLLLGPKAVGQK